MRGSNCGFPATVYAHSSVCPHFPQKTIANGAISPEIPLRQASAAIRQLSAVFVLCYAPRVQSFRSFQARLDSRNPLNGQAVSRKVL
ncbi:hypothetical protein SAMN05443245_1552 [Paraburkholderia fungorum]|uniref:Uncharacterized protein n=1 Tax=Paraburkholderia fungorum TaxID=134537 RepID=A0A1H1B8Z7_9BURK|nr:hypothetical protein SAMN05443245_1552 [Paraburkholderia fungorum]